MAQKNSGFERFWKELKRRKVVHVITVYAAVAFVILQLVDIVAEPLRLPVSTKALVIVLLCIGFIIAIFLSWVYDFTPVGIKKTKPASAIKHEDQTTHQGPGGWKITTYISLVVIVALIAFNFITRRNFNADISKLERSIAVLPFINDSGSDSTTYFINGLMEEVLNNLQKIKDFRVLSRTSTEQYKGTSIPTIPEIAEKLNVNYVVEGSGQKFGNFYRLRAQLISAKNERHLWADSYEKEINTPKDIYDTQSEIAKSIASALKTTITPEEKQLMDKTPTTSLTAYDFYQRGYNELIKYLLDNAKINSLKDAISYFRLALKSDSSFAQAYTFLAIALNNYYWENVNIKMKFSESELKVKRDSAMLLNDKALRLNDKLDVAHIVKGGWSDNSEMALNEYKKALECNPNSWAAYLYIARIYYFSKSDNINYIKNLLKAIELERGSYLPGLLKELGVFYERKGFNKNAIDIYNQIFQLTKDTLQYYQNMSGPYYAEQNWKESIRWAKKILEKNPDYEWAHNQLGWIYSYINKTDSAIYHQKKTIELDPYMTNIEYYKGLVLWESGNKMKANESFDKIIDFNERVIKSGSGGDYGTLTEIFSLKGDQKKAMEYFKLYSKPFLKDRWFMVNMENKPQLQNIRSTKEYQEILTTSKNEWQADHDKLGEWLKDQGMLKE